MEQLESAGQYNKLVVARFKKDHDWVSDEAVVALTNCLAGKIDMQRLQILAIPMIKSLDTKIVGLSIPAYHRNLRFDMAGLGTITGRFSDTDPIKGESE
tara:strand:+ start:5153 stop:5449 length:297 start_codon:yes stop_codon:yes gene_type:complete